MGCKHSKGGEATEIKKTGMQWKINKVSVKRGGRQQARDLREVGTKVKVSEAEKDR